MRLLTPKKIFEFFCKNLLTEKNLWYIMSIP
nr:hypothetical protein LMSGXRPZ_LMSGXRPZ_CDS_0005 [Microvirus sp.]